MNQSENFENTLRRLEEIVSKMEKGDLPLEDSISLFEEGIACSKKCSDLLKAAELKIKELKIDENGEATLRDVSEDEL